MAIRLLERERELELVFAALNGAVAGRGSVVMVEGPAGIGKTSLIEAIREAAPAHNVAVAAARASELETSYAWGVVRQLFEPRLRGMSEPARTRAFAGAAALARPVVLPEEREHEELPAFGVLHGLYWLVAELAAQRPQLLVVDDLHWADAASMRFLEFLSNRVDAVPVLVLAAQRPGLVALTLATGIELRAFSLEATTAVLAERSGAVPSGEFAAACHEATGGNPLLIRRLADGLHDRGTAADADAVREAGPYAIAGAVGSTLARLGTGPAVLAPAVAILEQAPLPLIARLAGLDPGEASECAERLVRAGLLRDARPLEFEHALVRDAILSRLSAGERSRLHADAARILGQAGGGVETVATQLLHTEPRGDEHVARVLAEAGRRALASGAIDEAAACLARAVAEPPAPGERSAVLLALARAEHGLGLPASLDHVVEAFDTAQDEQARAHAAMALMWASGPGRQGARHALAMIERALAGVRGRHRELELRLEAVRYMAGFLSPALLRLLLGDAERFADLEGRTPGECEVLLHAAVHRFLAGRSAAEVAEPLEKAVRDLGVVLTIGTDSMWFQMAVGALFKADRLDAARRTVTAALTDAQRRGSVPAYAAACVWRAWISLREGAAATAEADARAAFETLPADMWQSAICAACLIEVLIERGRLDEAQGVLKAAGGTGELKSDWLLYARSMLRAAQGDLHGALADQLATRPHLDAGPAFDPNFDGWLRIARLLHATQQGPAAEREAEAALAWARRWGTPGYIGQALSISGLLAGGDAGLARLRAGVEQLERSPAKVELARSLVELGAALRRRGERVAAREPLRRALELASAGGMVATGERAVTELRVTGATIHRPGATGIGSLTPSERRIAELAAGGASNAEIAQRLFVTVKTVEMHLGHAYRKLGISSRRQLAPLLAQP